MTILTSLQVHFCLGRAASQTLKNPQTWNQVAISDWPVRHLQNAKDARSREGQLDCHRPSTIRKSLCAASSNTLSAGLYRSLSYAAIAFSTFSNSTTTTD